MSSRHFWRCNSEEEVNELELTLDVQLDETSVGAQSHPNLYSYW